MLTAAASSGNSLPSLLDEVQLLLSEHNSELPAAAALVEAARASVLLGAAIAVKEQSIASRISSRAVEAGVAETPAGDS
jgi:hypothetical protein